MTQSFQAFRSLIDHSPDAISVINAHGEILYGSESTRRIFGYEPDEMVGRNCLDMMHPEDRPHASWALKEVLGTLGPLQWDVRIRQKDGTYCWVESTVSNLLFESEVRAIVMHQRDINARKAQEVEQQQRADELVRSNERLEEFAYTAAHDLREPLRAISAYTELLVEEAQLSPTASQMAKFIVAGTVRMSKLIDDLLAFAATGIQEPPKRVDLGNAAAQAAENLTLEIEGSGSTVTFDHLPTVLGNEIQLVRLLQNLIGNAVKYRSQETSRIHVSADQRDGEWVISVTDNGIGIAAQDQGRVFAPFVRLADRRIPGTGLGLAVCKKIVEGQGGKIWVESELGAGSTFRFTIAAETHKNGAQPTAFGLPSKAARI